MSNGRPNSNESRGRVDARVRETYELVLNEGLRLLLEEGAGAVTHSRICAATGVARTTIYRHWPTRASLLFDSFIRGRRRVELERTGDLRTDLVHYLRAIRDGMWESPITDVLVVVYEQMDNDPELAGVHEQIREYVRAELRELLTDAIDGGTLKTELSIEELCATLLGPLFYERLLARSSASDALIEHLVDSLLEAHRA